MKSKLPIDFINKDIMSALQCVCSILEHKAWLVILLDIKLEEIVYKAGITNRVNSAFI